MRRSTLVTGRRSKLRAVAISALFAALLGGCPDTRGTCPISCDNALRCGFAADRPSCESMCTTELARASTDCRTQRDRYERCWLGAGTCPPSSSNAAPGCVTEFSDRALACAFASPLTSDDGI